MFIVLLDEPGLFVFPSSAAAERDIEAIDAETEIRAAFDESAIPYRVEWVVPNRRQKFLFLTSIVPGEYCFAPAGLADPSALIALLEKHPDHTNPPEAKTEIARLLAELRSNTPTTS